MAKESIHDALGRVRPPRVHITYKVFTDGAEEIKELPFVVGVLGDFSGNSPEKPPPPVRDRRFIQIDRDNFDDVMARMTPGLNLRVANTLKDDGSEMPVQLQFREMDDFEPGRIVQQVEALRKLQETRDKLRDLLVKVDRSTNLEALLEKLLQNSEEIKKVQSELGGGRRPTPNPRGEP
jgi:type VI secretion system protein ImpB